MYKLMREPGGRIPRGSSGCRLEDNIKIDLKYVDCVHLGCDGMQWKVPMKTVANHQVP
jgi:hypothetical protein